MTTVGRDFSWSAHEELDTKIVHHVCQVNDTVDKYNNFDVQSDTDDSDDDVQSEFEDGHK